MRVYQHGNKLEARHWKGSRKQVRSVSLVLWSVAARVLCTPTSRTHLYTLLGIGTHTHITYTPVHTARHWYTHQNHIHTCTHCTHTHNTYTPVHTPTSKFIPVIVCYHNIVVSFIYMQLIPSFRINFISLIINYLHFVDNCLYKYPRYPARPPVTSAHCLGDHAVRVFISITMQFNNKQNLRASS